MAQVAVLVVLAAPSGAESGRPFAKAGERESFMRVVELYANRGDVQQRVCCVRPDDLQIMQQKYSAHLAFQGVQVAAGGPDWFGAAARGLAKLTPEIDLVFVHDACCPAVPYTLLDALQAEAIKSGAAVPVMPVGGHLAQVHGQRLGASEPRTSLMRVQSPQAFGRRILEQAYEQREKHSAVDDAGLVRAAGTAVSCIPGSAYNVRIDSEESMRLVNDALKHMPRPRAKGATNPFGEAEW